MNSGKVETIVNNHIGTVLFSHPQSNSLPGALLLGLSKEIEKAGKDDNIKVIVLKSEGEKAFCAGASFDELMSITNMEEGKKFFSGFASVINAMRKAPKFIVARIHSKAVGGGIGIAAAADYALAAEAASAKLSELALGIGPFVVGPAIERKTGTAAFSQMSVNPDKWFSAAWAREKGLYAEVYATLAELDREVESFSGKLARYSPEAMARLKKVLWEGTEHWDTLLLQRAEMSGELVLSAFTRNFIENFKRSRK
jgi:methylglutaconyl-CoA hydratase